MRKLQYLKKTIEEYEVIDTKTRAEFCVNVIEQSGAIYFDMTCHGKFTSDGALECAELLKELIVRDCYNANAREGEKPGQVKFLKNVSASVNKLRAKQKASFLPQDNDDSALPCV